MMSITAISPPRAKLQGIVSVFPLSPLVISTTMTTTTRKKKEIMGKKALREEGVRRVLKG